MLVHADLGVRRDANLGMRIDADLGVFVAAGLDAHRLGVPLALRLRPMPNDVAARLVVHEALGAIDAPIRPGRVGSNSGTGQPTRSNSSLHHLPSSPIN